MTPCLRIAALAIAMTLPFGPEAVAAAGPSVPLEDVGGQGVPAADGGYRYVALRESFGGGSETILLRINQNGGQVSRQRVIKGDFGVSSATFDSTPTGLSHDGSVLVLIDPRRTYSREKTKLLVLDAERLSGGPGEIVLKGDFSIDAVSPDGETLFLIEHPDRRDFGNYQVRSFDLESMKLDRDPILDSEEEPGEMRGFPQTRVTSNDGDWEYTLYDGGEHPFIHALNVAEATTVCIDVEVIKARDTYGASLEMSEDDGSIELTDRKGELRAVIDTETYEATQPAGESETAEAPAEGGGPDLTHAGLAAGSLALVALAALRIRRMHN